MLLKLLKIALVFTILICQSSIAIQYKDSSVITSEEELRNAILQLEDDRGRIFDIYRFILRNPEKIEHPEQIRSLLQNVKHKVLYKYKRNLETDFSQRLKKISEFSTFASRSSLLLCAGLSLVVNKNGPHVYDYCAGASCITFLGSLALGVLIDGYTYLFYDTIDNRYVENINDCIDAI